MSDINEKVLEVQISVNDLDHDKQIRKICVTVATKEKGAPTATFFWPDEVDEAEKVLTIKVPLDNEWRGIVDEMIEKGESRRKVDNPKTKSKMIIILPKKEKSEQ